MQTVIIVPQPEVCQADPTPVAILELPLAGVPLERLEFYTGNCTPFGPRTAYSGYSGYSGDQ